MSLTTYASRQAVKSRETFNVFDFDQHGSLMRADLHKFLSAHCGPAECNQMLEVCLLIVICSRTARVDTNTLSLTHRMFARKESTTPHGPKTQPWPVPSTQPRK